MTQDPADIEDLGNQASSSSASASASGPSIPLWRTTANRERHGRSTSQSSQASSSSQTSNASSTPSWYEGSNEENRLYYYGLITAANRQADSLLSPDASHFYRRSYSRTPILVDRIQTGGHCIVGDRFVPPPATLDGSLEPIAEPHDDYQSHFEIIRRLHSFTVNKRKMAR